MSFLLFCSSSCPLFCISVLQVWDQKVFPLAVFSRSVLFFVSVQLIYSSNMASSVRSFCSVKRPFLVAYSFYRIINTSLKFKYYVDLKISSVPLVYLHPFFFVSPLPPLSLFCSHPPGVIFWDDQAWWLQGIRPPSTSYQHKPTAQASTNRHVYL